MPVETVGDSRGKQPLGTTPDKRASIYQNLRAYHVGVKKNFKNSGGRHTSPFPQMDHLSGN